jgi:hypothetical protein
MNCSRIVDSKCPNGHVQKRKCYEFQPAKCKRCEIEEKRDDEILQRDMQLQDKRLRDQVKHDMDIADLEMQIQKIRDEAEDKKVGQERQRALEQKKRDLEAAQHRAAQSVQQDSHSALQGARPPPTTSATASDNNGDTFRHPDSQNQTPSNTTRSFLSNPPARKQTASELEWERQKRVDGAANAAIDELMMLTGLEDVKAKMLDIKAKVETVARQGIDMKKERMGMVMLGNPGTGMGHDNAELSF